MLDKEQESVLSRSASEIELLKAEIALLTYPNGEPLGAAEQGRLLTLLWVNSRITDKNLPEIVRAIFDY